MDLWSVDRIVGNVAVLIDVNGESCEISLADLPQPLQVGMMLRWIDNAFVMDEIATKERKTAIFSLQEKLRRKKR